VTTVPPWVRDLVTTGELDPQWGDILGAVPRWRFLPGLIWPHTDSGEYLTVDRADDPRTWRHWADSEAAIVTQWDDGNHTDRAPGTVPTSSSSQPSLVVQMLADLDPQPGEHVLDIGTGTGWTTALLATRAGPGNVTSVEVDPAVATAAARRLTAAGISTQIITGDGDQGWPAGAPYDRLHVTYAIRQLPRAWISQIRPGGVIVAPWRTDFAHPGAVVRLTVSSDGSATGPFTRPAEFMHDRHQRIAWPDHTTYIPGGRWPEGTRESTASIRPQDLWDNPYSAAAFAVGLLVPGVAHTTGTDDKGEFTAWLYELDGRSWAALYADHYDDDKAEVYQGGPRSLWDETESAYHRWAGHGQPDHTRLGLSITADGITRLWVDEPYSPDGRDS
jgi:protein-L-isoaspartate O-methyltransferase